MERVVERARPRARRADDHINHGDVAIIAAAAVRLTPVDIGKQPTTFALMLFVRYQASSSSFTPRLDCRVLR